MSLRNKLENIRKLYRDATTPEHVERAPRLERWKRGAWHFGALLVAFALYTAAAYVALLAGQHPASGALAVGLLATYSIIWSFGIDLFNVTAPWQFREAELEEERDTS